MELPWGAVVDSLADLQQADPSAWTGKDQYKYNKGDVQRFEEEKLEEDQRYLQMS